MHFFAFFCIFLRFFAFFNAGRLHFRGRVITLSTGGNSQAMPQSACRQKMFGRLHKVYKSAGTAAGCISSTAGSFRAASTGRP